MSVSEAILWRLFLYGEGQLARVDAKYEWGVFHRRSLNIQAVSRGGVVGSAWPLRRMGIRTQASNELAGQVQTGKVRAFYRIKRRKFWYHGPYFKRYHSLISSCTETNTFSFAQFPFYMHVLQEKAVHHGRKMVQDEGFCLKERGWGWCVGFHIGVIFPSLPLSSFAWEDEYIWKKLGNGTSPTHCWFGELLPWRKLARAWVLPFWILFSMLRCRYQEDLIPVQGPFHFLLKELCG